MRRSLLAGTMTVFALLTMGCGDLHEVTALHGVADGLRAALPRVSEDFYHSCERRAAIAARIPEAERPANGQGLTPDCGPAKQVAAQLGADQRALTGYLEALSQLSSGAGFTYGKAIGADVTAVNALTAGSGVNAAAAADAQKAGAAALTLAGKLADLATEHLRERAARRFVLGADPAVQALTTALSQVGDTDYALVLADEKGFLDAYYQGPMAARTGERLALLLVQRQYDGDLEALGRRREAAAAYGAAMGDIGALHAKLAEAARDRAGFAKRVKALAPEVSRLKDAVARLEGEVR